MPPENVIRSAAAGAPEMGGTLVAEICPNALLRGVVRTTWLGGNLSRGHLRTVRNRMETPERRSM